MNKLVAFAIVRTYCNNRQDIDLDVLQVNAWDDIDVNLEVQENEGVVQLVPSLSAFTHVSVAALPVDFGRVRVVTANGAELKPVDIQTLIRSAGLRRDQYALSGMSIYVQSTAPLVLIYSKRMPALIEDTDTNIILDRYPMMFIYCLAKHANARIQDFDAAEQYGGQYAEALAGANVNNVMASFSAGLAPVSQYAG